MLTKIVLYNPLILIRFLKTKMPMIILTSNDSLSFDSYSMQVLMQIELNSMAIQFLWYNPTSSPLITVRTNCRFNVCQAME